MLISSFFNIPVGYRRQTSRKSVETDSPYPLGTISGAKANSLLAPETKIFFGGLNKINIVADDSLKSFVNRSGMIHSLKHFLAHLAFNLQVGLVEQILFVLMVNINRRCRYTRSFGNFDIDVSEKPISLISCTVASNIASTLLSSLYLTDQ